ncbi:MAG TPA: beta-galactosidase, partial [Candidatus Saccharimonadales bacterium]|nr:beta-galactosidase [Candidatus Saccharimonadales bacterium]
MSASDSIVMGVVRFRFGASFSVKYARDLGLDWRQVLTEALDDIGIRRFRLMSHWDLIEPQPGQYDFGDLDWQMDQVAARDGEVSITIGLRQPHHPECHQPAWAKQ